MENKIIILCGFSGAGKDVAQSFFEQKGFNVIKSCTTRKMRPSESEGNPYYFLSIEDFKEKEKNNEFIEVRKYGTLVDNIGDVWYYGAAQEEVSKDKMNVVVLDLLGTRAFKKEFKGQCAVFFVSVDTEIRRKRCILRGDYDETEFNRRLEDDQRCFPMEEVAKEVDAFLYNNGTEEEFHKVLNDVYTSLAQGEI